MGEAKDNDDAAGELAQEIRLLRKQNELQQARELFAWAASRMRCSPETPPAAERVPVQAVSRATAHDAQVLDAVRASGFDPVRLPKTPPGKASPAKQPVRERTRLTRAQFDKAWQRLRADGKLREG